MPILEGEYTHISDQDHCLLEQALEDTAFTLGYGSGVIYNDACTDEYPEVIRRIEAL